MAAFFTSNADAAIRGHMQKGSGDHTQYSVRGWACQIGNPAAVKLEVFAGDSIENSVLISETYANLDSEIAIANICASEGRHRFHIHIPQAKIFEHQGKRLFVKAGVDGDTITLSGAENHALPSHPDTKISGYVDGIAQGNGAYFVNGWACQTNVSEPISVSISTSNNNGESIEIITDASTGVVAETAVRKLCKTSNGRHRFRVKLPESFVEEYAGRPLKVTAKAAFGSNTRKLPNPRSIKIPMEMPSPMERAPNVVIFFTDDQGYADLGINGVLDDIKTPNIDQLAINGARFTSGYITAPQCSPSRAAMLTGIHQSQFALDENQHIPLTRDVETLATKFQRKGYKTGMMGKWHLEVMSTSKEWAQKFYPELDPFRVQDVPQEVLDSYYPQERGFDDVFAGYTGKYVRNVNQQGRSIEPETYFNNGYRVDLTTEQSLSFVDRHWRSPFYLYVSHYAPHVPMQALQEHIDLFPEDMPHRRRYALAMMMAVDNGVGAIVDKLDAYNLLNNTLIFFISDNGAPLGDDMTDAPIAKRNEAWNGSRNDPYTGEKGMLTEGALRVPFIAHWPTRIAPGTIINDPVSSLDAAYTAAEVAGVDDLNSLDGMSLLPLIDGEEHTFNERPQHWRFYFQRAIRLGDWKYMQAGIEREYLFDMTQTYPESINLIEQYPEKASELRDLYWQWANQMPRPEPLVEIPAPFAKRVDSYLPTN